MTQGPFFFFCTTPEDCELFDVCDLNRVGPTSVLLPLFSVSVIHARKHNDQEKQTNKNNKSDEGKWMKERKKEYRIL